MTNPLLSPLLFMGSPDFSTPSLKALVDAGYPILKVFTQAPKPSGRGMKVTRSAVHQLADKLGLSVETPHRITSDVANQIKALNPACIIVAAYGHLLPKALLDIPPHGCLNLHASLLPRWRGASPVHQAILHGDSTTGISLMKMDVGMDTGPVYHRKALTIDPDDTTQSLTKKLSHVAADLLIQELPGILKETSDPTPQPSQGITYAPKIHSKEFFLDAKDSAETLARRVRAFYPKAFFMLDKKRLRVLKATATESPENAKTQKPGTLYPTSQNLFLITQKGALAIHTLQTEGKKPTDVLTFLNSYRVSDQTDSFTPSKFAH